MSNPILNDNFAADARVIEGDTMTVNGTIQKTLIMLVMLVLAASYTWQLTLQGFADKAEMLGIIGAVIALVAVIVMSFSKKASGVLAAVYSVGEGFFLGTISYVFEKIYPGIVVQAVAGTFAAMFSMLFLYRTGFIKYTEKFRAVWITAVMSVCLIYIIQFVASLFSRGIPQLFTSSPIGIGFSCIVVLIAAFGFIMDFEFIVQGTRRIVPKSYEWMGAVGLMTSIVWLYVELLRLLQKLYSRN